MGRFVKGDVVVLLFPFSDLSATRKRPALVLAVPKDDEVIVCQITKEKTRPEYTIELTKNDFSEGGLRLTSYIRPNHVFMAEPTIIEYCAGKLKSEKIQKAIDIAVKILQEK